MDILTITLNPALDISTYAPMVRAGPKLRCAPPVIEPGGGGINVSRAVSYLGGSSTAFIAIGGANGAVIADLLGREGINVAAFEVAGDTRQSLAVTNQENGEQFRFVLPGPVWSNDTTQDVNDRIDAMLEPDMLVVLSGSLPGGVPASFVATLNARVKARSGRLIVDTSGQALAQMVSSPLSPVFALRLDAAEAASISDTPLETASQIADLGQSLVAKGVAETVVIGFGEGGNVGVSAKERLLTIPPVVQPVSKVGAGDSFVAAFSLATSRGNTLAQALAFGTAAATSAVTTEATQLCDGKAAERYLANITIEDC